MKQNIKLIESRIENLNKVVPYQLNLLSASKTHMYQQYEVKNFTAVRQEKVNSERTIRQLKKLLVDIETLRKTIRDEDLDRFDKMTQTSRQSIKTSLTQFEDFFLKLRLNLDQQNSYDSASEKYSAISSEDEQKYRQLQLQIQEELLEQERQDELMSSLNHIQNETKLVNELFHDIAQVVNDQKEKIDSLEDNIESAHVNVVQAEKQLARAAKAKVALYPLTGALIGTLIGGPVGLIGGLKIGTVCALSGTVLGFTGGAALKKVTVSEQKQLASDISKVD